MTRFLLFCKIIRLRRLLQTPSGLGVEEVLHLAVYLSGSLGKDLPTEAYLG